MCDAIKKGDMCVRGRYDHSYYTRSFITYPTNTGRSFCDLFVEALVLNSRKMNYRNPL